MLFDFHIFGVDKSTYFQFPEDGKLEILRNFCTESTEDTCLSINRKANIVDYLYCKTLNDDSAKKLGISISFNGSHFNDINAILNLFESLYIDILSAGKILQFDNKGHVEYASTNFSALKQELSRLVDFINAFLEKEKHNIAPNNNNFSGVIGRKSIALSAGSYKIVDCTEKFSYVVVDIGNTSHLRSNNILQTITRLNAEKEALQEEYNAIVKQKKQFKWVAILSLAVIVCLVGLYFLNDNLSAVISRQMITINNLNDELGLKRDSVALLTNSIIMEQERVQFLSAKNLELNNIVKSYADSLSYAKQTVDDLQAQNNSIQQDLNSQKRLNSEKEKTISSLKYNFPINITDIKIGNVYNDGKVETENGSTIYNWNTMYLSPKITYQGLSSGKSINLRLKWYTPDGSLSRGSSSPPGCSTETSLYVYSGTNTTKLSGWGNEKKGHWKKGTYRLEIWYNDVCLQAKTFTIQ